MTGVPPVVPARPDYRGTAAKAAAHEAALRAIIASISDSSFERMKVLGPRAIRRLEITRVGLSLVAVEASRAAEKEERRT